MQPSRHMLDRHAQPPEINNGTKPTPVGRAGFQSAGLHVARRVPRSTLAPQWLRPTL